MSATFDGQKESRAPERKRWTSASKRAAWMPAETLSATSEMRACWRETKAEKRRLSESHEGHSEECNSSRRGAREESHSARFLDPLLFVALDEKRVCEYGSHASVTQVTHQSQTS